MFDFSVSVSAGGVSLVLCGGMGWGEWWGGAPVQKSSWPVLYECLHP